MSLLRGQIFPIDTLKNNGSTSKRINIVFLGDGYLNTVADQNLYINDVKKVMAGMFSQTPFLEYEKYFNVYAIKIPSLESGAKHAGTATDVTEPLTPVTNPNNYFGSRFDVSNIHRLLAPANSASIFTTLTNNFPDYDQVFVLVNSSVYGGSGGTFATSSTNVSASEIAIHEIGHSFAKLGDEYWFNCGEAKNRTSNSNAATIKWSNWLGSNNIGIHKIEGSSPDCYRPHANCKMKSLGAPFCSVCREGFIDKIYNIISPIDYFTPLSKTINFTGSAMPFALNLILPNPNTLKIEWVLNGATIATNVDNINLLASRLDTGNNTLIAKVTDGTALSRVYQPATSGYLNTVTWIINKSGGTSPVIQVNQTDKIRYEIYPNPVSDALSILLNSESTMDVELSLFDLQGRKVYAAQRRLKDELLENIDMSRFAIGHYVLNIRMGNHVVEKKIVIQ